MGEIEDRLKAMNAGKQPEKLKIKSEIEKALEEADNQEAQDILRAQGRRRKAEEELRAREAEQRLRQTGGFTTMEETEEQKREREIKEKADMMTHAKALYDTCIDGGGDPTSCAQMVAGLIPTSPGITAPQPTSVSDLIDALVKLDQLRGSDRGLADLKQSFDKLAEEIRKGNTSQQPLDPIGFAKQQAEALAAWHKAMEEITPKPVVTTAGGKSLDVVKEDHRHEEKMEEVKAETDYKKKLGDAVADLPESVGRGLGGQIMEGRGKSSSSGDGLDYFTCEDCGEKIPITPGADKMTCKKCGSIYSRKGTVETKQE